ncbi:MAG: heavy-metal-associated domain-containing protein [Flavobacteriales bacterium]|nr:heavy-metal-associated domain-containing protein [Flavobacteriales bacterium]
MIQTNLTRISLSCLLLFGCSQTCDYELTEIHQAGTAVRTTARIDVTGMMCAQACGGKIKKELLEVQGVANAVIDFELDRDMNHAEVEFDPAQVQLDELVAAVTGIADGKLYGVEAVQLTHFAKAATFP